MTVIRKSGKIRAANSRIDQMTSLSLDFFILYSMIDGIYTLLVPTRPLQLLPSTALTTQLRMISIRVASVCKSSDLPFSLDLVNYWIVSRQYRNSNAATRPAAVNAPVAEQTMVQNVWTLSGNFSVTFWISARLGSEADNLPCWRNQPRIISEGKLRHAIDH